MIELPVSPPLLWGDGQPSADGLFVHGLVCTYGDENVQCAGLLTNGIENDFEIVFSQNTNVIDNVNNIIIVLILISFLCLKIF